MSSSHLRIQHWKRLLEEIGCVYAFDHPYLAQRRRRPDPLPKLIEAHRKEIAEARRSDKMPVVLIGKSMGGRAGCHATQEEDVTAVICISYPSCGGGDRTKLRVGVAVGRPDASVLEQADQPVLVVVAVVIDAPAGGARLPVAIRVIAEADRRRPGFGIARHLVEQVVAVAGAHLVPDACGAVVRGVVDKPLPPPEERLLMVSRTSRFTWFAFSSINASVLLLKSPHRETNDAEALSA